MSEIADRRLSNLKRICQAKDLRPTGLSQTYGRSVSFWSDLLRGRKHFGEKLAREIEEAMGLSPLFLDKLLGLPLSLGELDGFEGQLVMMFRRLSDDQKHALLVDLNNATAPTAGPSASHPFRAPRKRANA